MALGNTNWSFGSGAKHLDPPTNTLSVSNNGELIPVQGLDGSSNDAAGVPGANNTKKVIDSSNWKVQESKPLLHHELAPVLPISYTPAYGTHVMYPVSYAGTKSPVGPVGVPGVDAFPYDGSRIADRSNGNATGVVPEE